MTRIPAPPIADSVGLFDSGVGGLSVLRALRAHLPFESFIYVADSLNSPYGDRPTAFIETRAQFIVDFLVHQGAKAIVIACNTASVAAARSLRDRYHLPIVAMEPGIKPAALASATRTVLVLATPYTVRSESVASLCQRFGAGVRILLQACPGLAEQVERGKLHDAETRRLLELYLRPGLEAGADTVVLGCTHYAFLADEISLLAGPAVTLIEPSQAIARQLARVLPAAPSAAARPSRSVFYTSGSVPEMRAFLAAIGEQAEPVYALPVAAP
jgi:glutamate racemase